MHFNKSPIDGELANELRKVVRRRRRQPIDGHRFTYTDLKSLWVSRDHVVLTHNKDAAWQHWHLEEDGWAAVGVHDTKAAAVDAASEEPGGLLLLARWPRDPRGKDTVPMRVQCSSDKIADSITEIFEKLGCIVVREAAVANIEQSNVA